jgi:hypothetical protein
MYCGHFSMLLTACFIGTANSFVVPSFRQNHVNERYLGQQELVGRDVVVNLYFRPALTSGTIREGDDPEKERKQKLANDFVKSIREKPEPILSSDGMFILPEVVFLEGGQSCPLIIRKITEPFWNSVIETVDEQNKDGFNKNRVCAVGTPGIGKSRSIPILIRMLLERGKSVVYFIQRPLGEGYYYEFIPGGNNDNNTTVNVYEELQRKKIASLQSPKTYYIVDPSNTKDNCDKGSDFLPKVIIVASPDERHWGESEFEKEREGIAGFFQYMPQWELEELQFAAPFLCHNDPELKALLNDPFKLNLEILDRYRIFGGVPRHIFGSRLSRERRLAQVRAIGVLKSSKVR